MDDIKYWESRKAQQMYEYIEDAEETLKVIERAYKSASNILKRDAQAIFDKFKSKYNLTEKEAENLLSRVRSGKEIQDIKTMLALDPNNQDLRTQLESQAYGARLSKLANIYENIDAVLIPMIRKIEISQSYAFYERLAKKSYYNGIFDLQKYSGYGFKFKTLTEDNIKSVLSERWYGNDFSTSIWGNTERLAEEVKHELLVNLLTGRPLKQAQDSIEQKFGKGQSNARRLMRTESNYIANQMQLKGYKASEVEHYIYLATLDLRTSKVCRALDGKTFAVSSAAVGRNYPPMHPYCRSTTIAYIPDKLREKWKRSAIDSNGKRILIRGNMTYQEWYDKYINQ